MATEKKENAFMHWYHSYQGKNVINIIYSVGASVVIVGALFKILHWPGASQVLMIGMFTEAFLFIIGALEAPHEEFHWGNVFPQLLEYGSPVDRVEAAEKQPKPTLLSSADMAAAPVQQSNKDAAKVPSLSDKELEALSKGIKDLAGTAEQLASIGKVAESTNKLSAKAEAAAEAADQFAQAAVALGQKNGTLGAKYDAVANELNVVVDNTKAFGKGVNDSNAKLSAINSVYELQLAALQANQESIKAHGEALKAQSAEVAEQTKQIKSLGAEFGKVNDKIVDLGKDVEAMKAANEVALKNQQAYQEATKKLAAQVADLNSVYGNMLNALA